MWQNQDEAGKLCVNGNNIFECMSETVMWINSGRKKYSP